jgi:hypothetical protein
MRRMRRRRRRKLGIMGRAKPRDNFLISRKAREHPTIWDISLCSLHLSPKLHSLLRISKVEQLLFAFYVSHRSFFSYCSFMNFLNFFSPTLDFRSLVSTPSSHWVLNTSNFTRMRHSARLGKVKSPI